MSAKSVQIKDGFLIDLVVLFPESFLSLSATHCARNLIAVRGKERKDKTSVKFLRYLLFGFSNQNRTCKETFLRDLVM